MQSSAPSSGAKYTRPIFKCPLPPDPPVPEGILRQPATASAPAADWTSMVRRVMHLIVIRFLRGSVFSNVIACQHLGDCSIQLFTPANVLESLQQILRPDTSTLALLQVVKDSAFVH